MKAFTQPLEDLAVYREVIDARKKKQGVYAISGCTDAQKPHMIAGLNQGTPGCILVTFSEQKARELLETVQFFTPQAKYYPAKDILFYQSDIRGNALTRERMLVYRALMEEEYPVVVTTFDALMDRMVPPEIMKAFVLHVEPGDEMDLTVTRKHLVHMGYEYNHQAEMPGQFSVRGGILDIYPLTDDLPIRIELWGDEVDSIRNFSPETQKSVETLEEVDIYPAGELVLTPQTLEAGLKRIDKEGKKVYETFRKQMKTEEAFHIKESVTLVQDEIRANESIRGAESYLSYFYEDTVGFLDFAVACAGTDLQIYVDEPARCKDRAEAVEIEFAQSMEHRLEKGYVLPGQVDALFSPNAIQGKMQNMSCILLSSLDMGGGGFSPMKSWYLQVQSINAYNSSFELLVKDLKRYKKEKYRIVLLCGSRSRGQRMAVDLRDEGLAAFYSEDSDRVLQDGEVMVLYGKVKKGFSYPDIKFVVLTETDIFGGEKKKKLRKKFNEGQRIASFSELNPGDYVVHENHGLGIYRGIEKIEVDHVMKDYMKIEYAKGGNLYVQATQLDVIQKYANADAKKPKLNRLGGQEWTRTRSRVQTAVCEIAQELVELYAIRQNTEGYEYGPDTVWQREFEEMFPFEETDDQQIAIANTKADMESKKIMDRLICGDVGFGKTEVAIRAAFKAVQENKQVVYLVPTTILAQQHYNTFVQRMRDFPVNVELLCRFRTAKEQKETIDRLGRGLVDIVIGTHRVLSKDVTFKDLGLLIIDEEQRFGVTHKEKIKQLKKNVDVLTLTATPIPRTLHMSLIGIRDMSVLEEPPRDRMPIQTYVMEYNEEMVREAIGRELARNGQVYYVFNRVKQIADMAARIQELLPDSTVAYAHGQMSERELENIMYSFINGEIDVLVATTIIETGLDISNVNTMIIHDADNMGLSQLYQLRGRIGRSNRTAYAFLMYRRNKLLREVAEKRLSAIREFSELGSGIKIAMKDLELRGAGNLLGEAQSGHMEAVGYDLYCKMLNQAVKTAKGEVIEEPFETTVDIGLDAFIPATYIVNEYQKLDIYKRIAAIRNEEQQDEMLDELIDRFGEPPKPVQNLLTIARLRGEAHALYFTEVKEQGKDVVFRFYPQAKIDPTKLPDFLKAMSPYVKLVPEKEAPYLVYQKQKNSPSVLEIIQSMLEVGRQILL